jgi:hypothetical protein
VKDVVEVGGFLGEQVAAPERHPIGRAAAVAPQIDDQRVCPGDQLHRRGDRRAGVLRHRHPAQVEVADVAVQAFDAVDAEVVQSPRLTHLPPSRLTVGWLAALGLCPVAAVRAARPAPGIAAPRAADPPEPHPQVLVTGCLLQVAGEQLGERDLVQVVVFPGRQPCLDSGGDLLGQLREHIVLAQQRQSPHDDVPAGQLLGGQRTVIRHAYHRSRRRVGGELQQPGRRQPQRQLPPQLFHPLPVHGSPRSQIFRCGGKHPDRQLARIIAVPKQLGPRHRALRKQFLDAMVKNPCYLFHAQSTARATPEVPRPRG